MRIFINAKTEERCRSIASALEELSPETTLCFDDETASSAELREYDAVIVSAPLRSEFGLNYVADISKRTEAGIIVLARTDIAEDVQRRIKFTGAFVLAKPFQRSSLIQTVKMVVVAKDNLSRVMREKDELSRRLDDMRIIDRAKCCLIEYLNLSEQEAHRHIQKLAMDTRRTQREVAEDILRTYSV